MVMPPTSGIAPLWCLRSFGLSTKPICLAILRIVNSVTKEKKKTKLSSMNMFIMTLISLKYKEKTC